MEASTIIGIGTARGGTQSLAHVLQEQGLDIGHEESVSIPWERNMPTRYGRTVKHLRRTDGDVACWLTQAAADLMHDLPGAKVLATLRPKEDTVDSLVECFGAQRIRVPKPFGPMCFPTYTDCSVQEGWSRYWQDYRQEVAKLTAAYPERTLCVTLEDLGTEDEQERIAGFLGIEGWNHVTDCHKGKREHR